MSTEIVKSETGAVAPSTKVARGFEKMDVESVSMPTAKLMQPTSPEITQEEFSDYGFKGGQIVHSLLLERLPDTFIPLLIYEDRICFVPKQDAAKQSLKAKVKQLYGVELTDDDMKGMFVCRSDDNATGSKFGNCEDCTLCKFTDTEKPFCSRNVNVLALFEGQELPVVIRFTGTSNKHGRKFKNLAFFAGGDLFARKYKLLTAKKSQNGNTWYEMSVQPAGKAAEGDFKVAEAMYKRFFNVAISVNEPFEDAAPSTEGEF
jgi:hypothetical protein